MSIRMLAVLEQDQGNRGHGNQVQFWTTTWSGHQTSLTTQTMNIALVSKTGQVKPVWTIFRVQKTAIIFSAPMLKITRCFSMELRRFEKIFSYLLTFSN